MRYALACLLAAGCSPKPPPPTPVADSPGVTLLDPGRPPRRELRFSARTGERRTVAYSSGGVYPDGGTTPGFSLRLELEVTAVAADGSITTRSRVTEAAFPDDRSRQIFASFMESLRGPITTEVRSDRGAVLSSSVEPPDRSPFGVGGWIVPVAPVGVGARWQVHDLEARGPPERDDAVYELVSRDGDRVTARVTQHAPAAGMPRSQGTADFDSTGEISDDLTTAAIERYATDIDERGPVARRSRTVSESLAPR